MNKLVAILVVSILYSCHSEQENAERKSPVQENFKEVSDSSMNEPAENSKSSIRQEKPENLAPVYYESVMPDPMKHWGGLHEYFQISKISDSVIGVGVGIADGDPPWEFDFTGTIMSDSVYLVRVNYRQEGYAPVSTQEKWVLNPRTGDFIISGHNRPTTGRRYVSSEIDDFPQFIRDSLQNMYWRFHEQSVSLKKLNEKTSDT